MDSAAGDGEERQGALLRLGDRWRFVRSLGLAENGPLHFPAGLAGAQRCSAPTRLSARARTDFLLALAAGEQVDYGDQDEGAYCSGCQAVEEAAA